MVCNATQTLGQTLGQVIGIDLKDEHTKRVYWVLSDGLLSFNATVDAEIAAKVSQYSIVQLLAFKLIKYVCESN